MGNNNRYLACAVLGGFTSSCTRGPTCKSALKDDRHMQDSRNLCPPPNLDAKYQCQTIATSWYRPGYASAEEGEYEDVPGLPTSAFNRMIGLKVVMTKRRKLERKKMAC